MSKLMRGIICVAIGAIIWFIPAPEGVSAQAWGLLAVFAATIAGFILQPMPIGACSIIGMTLLPLLGIMKAGQALEGFANGTIWLIVSAFMFAISFIKTGLGRRIAYILLSKFGGSTLSVAYVMSATDFIIAPFTPSNTARGGGIVYPIVRSICETLGSRPDEEKLRKTGAFLIFSSYCAVITSACIFMTGASNNVLANKLAQDTFGQSIGWGDWFICCIIPGLLLTIITPYILYKLIKPELTTMPETKEMAHKELSHMGPMTTKEWILVFIFLGALFLWATNGHLHTIDNTFVALGGVSIMLLTNILTWDDIASEKGAWDVLVWMGVLVNMAAYLSKFGLMNWFADTMAAQFAGMSWLMMLIVLSIIYTFAHYVLASNSAHIMALFVAFAVILVAAGAPALGVMILFACLANSASFLTHYGCGVTPIFFGAGFMDQGQWWRLGFIITVLHLVAWLGLGLPLMGMFGYL